MKFIVNEVTGATVLIKVTPDKKIVGKSILENLISRSQKEAPALGFYKAQSQR